MSAFLLRSRLTGTGRIAITRLWAPRRPAEGPCNTKPHRTGCRNPTGRRIEVYAHHKIRVWQPWKDCVR